MLAAVVTSPAESADQPVKTGTLRGRLIFDGTPPPPQPLIAANLAQSDRADLRYYASLNLRDESVVVSPTGGLRDVLITVHDANFPTPPPTDKTLPHPPAEIIYENGNFAPRLLATDVGRTLLLRNNDRYATNFRLQGQENDINVMLLPGKSLVVPLKPEKRDLPILVNSSVYPWAKSYLYVGNHPLAAITDASGDFELTGLPPGEWTFRVWHPHFGYLNMPHWPKGQFRVKIAVGGNDLEAVKVAPPPPPPVAPAQEREARS
ncbi:MAG: carboxypeptidase-like regulatory domain-containing protein [Pirellulales bacterium]|nr:carboxypeptidase-like regulatory domain-containing protein [Pirellulales bacterium]